jgi:hypothetical protein
LEVRQRSTVETETNSCTFYILLTHDTDNLRDIRRLTFGSCPDHFIEIIFDEIEISFQLTLDFTDDFIQFLIDFQFKGVEYFLTNLMVTLFFLNDSFFILKNLKEFVIFGLSAVDILFYVLAEHFIRNDVRASDRVSIYD